VITDGGRTSRPSSRAGKPGLDWRGLLGFRRSWRSQQVDEHFVKSFSIKIDPYLDGLDIDFRFVLIAPAEDAAVAGAAIQVHIRKADFRFRDQAR